MSSGHLNAARHFFRAGAYVLFLAGSLLLIRWTFDVNPAEIVVQKLSSMVPSTALVLVTAGAFLLALLHEVEIDGSQFPLSPSRSGTSGRTFCRSSHPKLWVTDREYIRGYDSAGRCGCANQGDFWLLRKQNRETFLALDEFAV